MRLDSQVKEVLATLATLPAPAPGPFNPTEVRLGYESMRELLQPAAPQVAQIENQTIDGPGGPLALRVYRAAGSEVDARLPGVVFFHGGGWVLGSLRSHDVLCRQLANAMRAVVVAVDYRLAPEHKFPAAYDDAWAATVWVAQQAESLGINPAHLIVAGDSAGGNLAAAVALAARDAGNLKLAMQLLIYPVVEFGFATESYSKMATGFTLTRDAMVNFRDCYLRDTADERDWRAAPLLAANHRGVAPTYIITAGYDPLCDEGEAYAEILQRADVPVTHECFEGMVHGFIGMGGRVAAANHAIGRIAQIMRQTLGFTKVYGAAPQSR